MTEYIFEIQALIKVKMVAESAEEARSKVIGALNCGEYDLSPDAYVSDGEAVK